MRLRNAFCDAPKSRRRPLGYDHPAFRHQNVRFLDISGEGGRGEGGGGWGRAGGGGGGGRMELDAVKQREEWRTNKEIEQTDKPKKTFKKRTIEPTTNE